MDTNINIEKKGNNNGEVIVKRKDGKIVEATTKDKLIDIKNKDNTIPEEDILIGKDGEPKDIFDFGWKFIVVVLGFLGVLMIGLVLLLSTLPTSAERIQHIKDQISEAQQENITIAETELVRLDSRREQQLRWLSITQNDILIYQNCIVLNQTQELPVDCSTITLSLKQKLHWKVNSNGFSQEYKPLKESGLEERTKELLNMYSLTKNTYPTWKKFEEQYGIKMQVAIAIAKADSSLGDEMKSNNNVGNVGNNDRGDTRHYNTIEDGIEAIYKTLNNKYLGNIYNIGYLSQGGRDILGGNSCSDKGEFCYATSKENWNINTINTLRLLYNDASIDEAFEFRL